MRLVALLLLWAGTVAADPVDDVLAAARNGFARMPDLVIVERIAGTCGADDAVNAQAAYCTTDNAILMTPDARGTEAAPYLLAHLLGHAVQVQHGVADVALRTIHARPEDEAALRGMVTRQVECIAGFLLARAGMSADLSAHFAEEPFADAHWGRNPLSVGPVVSIGVDARAEWLARGQEAPTLAACAVGEMGADLLLRAYRD